MCNVVIAYVLGRLRVAIAVPPALPDEFTVPPHRRREAPIGHRDPNGHRGSSGSSPSSTIAAAVPGVGRSSGSASNSTMTSHPSCCQTQSAQRSHMLVRFLCVPFSVSLRARVSFCLCVCLYLRVCVSMLRVGAVRPCRNRRRRLLPPPTDYQVW